MPAAGLGGLFGKPGKTPWKRQRPEQVPGGPPAGPSSGSNAIPGSAIRYGVQPVPLSFARRLFLMTTLVSPAVAGRFRPQDRGQPERRAESTDLGTLQSFRGAVGTVSRANLGAQAGPSSQPGYPSTNAGDITGQLAAMGLPDVWRVKGS